MKSKVMSMDEPRRPSPGRGRDTAYRNGAEVSYSGPSRISPWLPVALGAVTVLLVARALTQDNRSTTQRWLDTASRRAHGWWPELRDTAEDYSHRASRYVPDYASTRDWLHDMLPSRRGISNLFARGSEWLPDTGISKRRLLANFDLGNPPRWLRRIDLSSESKRRQFLKDVRRYGTRGGNDLLSSIGWR